MENEKYQRNRQSVQDLLNIHGIKPSKAMGQNFLIDANVPAKIVSKSGITKSCGILEVGPGLGALTHHLGEAAGKVTAVELDKRLVEVLSDIFADYENIKIVQGDILKKNIKKLTDETMSGLTHHVCANLPYNITTPAIAAFIETGIFESIIVMIQKEVAQRICAKPGSSEYGAFTVFANYYTEPEVLFDVSPECFIPRPKVTSTVIKMNTKAKLPLGKNEEKQLFQVVKAAFGQRRKTLVNALYSVFGSSKSKEYITEIVGKCGFETNIRGEVLSLEDFINLSLKL
ncbi:MAG: 16S rRNA (adenine(1518)-N(6)/adenine(1519)-N(6))-dimethyltransferase RsmA [Oscillospiraceae bacterium]|nr:16S rRNA (adenine(1518)-N(6)/adenine(1519)-N(6))-dimethyltransferase RsmA [Oscillospiraceae bacterium]